VCSVVRKTEADDRDRQTDSKEISKGRAADVWIGRVIDRIRKLIMENESSRLVSGLVIVMVGMYVCMVDGCVHPSCFCICICVWTRSVFR
jgi:hypothetical protein